VALLVPGRLAAQPAYGPFVEMATHHAGPDAASLLSTYFACGELGRARFGSVDAFVAAEVESTPLIGRISGDVYGRIREGAREVLRPFTTPTGRVEIPLEAHLVAARP
jgi:hypothetical protein